MTGALKKIMVIDDEEDVTFFVAKRLKASGYEVVCHYKGEGSLELIRTERPDLIFLDIWLRDLSGRDVFLKLRGDPLLAGIPVIFFSADPSEEESCMNDLKADGFLKKPYDAQEMLNLTKTLLDKGLSLVH